MDDFNVLKDLSGVGKNFTRTGLDSKEMHINPIHQFLSWIDDAINAGIEEPNAMVLSTVSLEKKPSSRVVLLKYLTENGFVFFTNYQSKKGMHIEQNNQASLLFYWEKLERQVRVEGEISRTSSHFSDEYFNSRALDSQLGAIVSPQSQIIPSIDYLFDKKEELKQSFKNKKLVRPYYWGAYLLKPDLIEFFQGRPNRLSDRIQYRIEAGEWLKERIAP